MEEAWRSLERLGHRGYDVSNLGRVRSYWKYGGGGGITNSIQKMLNPFTDADGYLCLRFFGGGIYKSAKVHRLVAMAFLGESDLPYVCHRDGNPQNNRYENLYWATPKQNTADMVKHGTMCYGEKHPGSKLTKQNVIDARLSYAAGGISSQELADKYKITQGIMHAILSGKKWRQAGGPIHKPGNDTWICSKKIKDLMRDRIASGSSYSKLAKKYGISISHVRRLVIGESRMADTNVRS